jgi:hypothetical protein
LEKELKIRWDTLNAEKQERLGRLRLRSKVDQELCDALSMTPYYIPSGSVPNDRQLAELEEHIRTLEIEQVRISSMLAVMLHVQFFICVGMLSLVSSEKK